MHPQAHTEKISRLYYLIREIAEDVYDERSANFSAPEPSYHSQFSLSISSRSNKKIGCLIPEKLPKLHDLLQNKYVLIDYKEYPLFEARFIGNKIPGGKIIWLGQANELTFLFLHLIAKKFLPPQTNPFKTIAGNFCKANGNDFNNERLSKNQSKGILKNCGVDHLISLVNELLQ